MLVFLLSVVATSERQFLQAYAATPAYPQSPGVPQGVSSPEDADGRVWLAKAYGQNYEAFNQLRGDSSGFVYDAQTQSYVPVVTHSEASTEMKGSARSRSSWWSRVFFVAFSVLAFAKRVNVVPLMRYALVHY
jgi:hypothetical protein